MRLTLLLQYGPKSDWDARSDSERSTARLGPESGESSNGGEGGVAEMTCDAPAGFRNSVIKPLTLPAARLFRDRGSLCVIDVELLALVEG